MGMPRMNRRFAILLTFTLLPIVALATVPTDARAQGGTITGQVTDAGTGAPVELAQVTVEGTRISVSTTAQGRYLVTGVSAGVRTVTVQRLGYSDASQEVTVPEGGAVSLDFALTTAPVNLSGIVVTTTGEQQKMSIANVIATIGADSIVTSAPITNVTDLLQGRVPGVMTFSNAGMTGSSARVRIRGFNSLSQDNTPLMIIDGVRVENTTIDEGGKLLRHHQHAAEGARLGDARLLRGVYGDGQVGLAGERAAAVASDDERGTAKRRFELLLGADGLGGCAGS